MSRVFRCVALFAVTAVGVSLLSTRPVALFAQQKGNPPAVPATYPTLTSLANIGAKRGTTADLTLTGTNLADATAVWTSFGGKVTIPDGQKDATKLNVKIEVPADTPIGMHTIRVATKTGVSNLRPFVIDELPEVAEKDNNKKAAPQVIPTPCVVLGTATAEVSDYYKIPVKAGEPLTIEVLGRRIGSPLDPVVILYDGTGRELPNLYADDTPGLQSDARITHTFPSNGEIIVEMRDTTFRGGADFAYRLRVGNFPGATTAFPLAVERGKAAEAGFAGPGVNGTKPVSVKGDGEVVNVIPRRAERREPPGVDVSGWPIPVRVSDHPEQVEQEPNNTPARANVLPVPGGVSARFGEKNDLDHFKFAAKKGQKVVIQALTFEVNAPTEVYLRVLDAKGAELAKSNPQQIGTRVEFTAPADGDFVIACEHTNYLSGPNEVYHLSVKPLVADFAVTLPFDRLDVPAGGVGLLPITGLAKLNGFNAEVTVEFVGDGVSGKVTLPAAANPQPATPLYLPLTVKADAKPGLVIGKVTATAKIDGKDVTRTVDLLEAVKGSLAGMPTPPQEVRTPFAVAVIPAPPFALELKLDKTEVVKGGALKGKIVAKRADKFDAEIAVAAVSVPANVAPKLVAIKKGENEAAVELTVPATVATGPGVVIFKGTAKVNNKDVVSVALPVTITATEPPKKEEPKKEEPKKK
jgi:hypothetical protein